MPWSPIPCESTENGLQLVGLIVKFGPALGVLAVDVDLDRAHPDRDAADDARHRVGDGGHVGVERVDLERDPDDDDAVVVGAGERGRDRRQRERRAFERAGQVHPADRVEGVFAGAGGDVGRADQRGARAAAGSAVSAVPLFFAAARIAASGQ